MQNLPGCVTGGILNAVDNDEEWNAGSVAEQIIALKCFHLLVVDHQIQIGFLGEGVGAFGGFRFEIDRYYLDGNSVGGAPAFVVVFLDVPFDIGGRNRTRL